MANINVLPSGNWRAQICVNKRRESRSFRTKREAAAWASIRESELTKESEKRRSITDRFGKFPTKDVEYLYDNQSVAPNTSGVYVLFNVGVPTYVGKSMNVLGRIAEHSSKGRSFTHYSFIACSPSELDSKEAELIKIISPKENKALTEEYFFHRRKISQSTFSAIKATTIDDCSISPAQADDWLSIVRN